MYVCGKHLYIVCVYINNIYIYGLIFNTDLCIFILRATDLDCKAKSWAAGKHMMGFKPICHQHVCCIPSALLCSCKRADRCFLLAIQNVAFALKRMISTANT